MSHYYINDENLDSVIKSYDVKINDISFCFVTDRGVFSKGSLDFGTQLLLHTISVNNPSSTIIDMGCGYGPIGLYLAKKYPETKVFLYDVNQRALDLARTNQVKNNVTNVTIKKSYLFENVNFKADLIITNPPIRAGKKVVFDLYEGAHENLSDGGTLYVVIQKKQGALSSVEKMKQIFGNCKIVDKKKGYWILVSKK